jgi:hypothetical protein
MSHADRRLRQADFVLRCGADETGIHAVGDGVDDVMASAIAIKSDVCDWQLPGTVNGGRQARTTSG